MLAAALTSIKPSWSNITKDKVNLVLTLIPIGIGLILYYFLGSWIYESAMGAGQDLIERYISKDTWGAVFYYIAATVLTVMLFFLVNWTFVLAVTFIASPFNDVLSARVENKMKGEANLELGPTFSRLFSKIFFTLFNEAKKIFFIVVLSVLSFMFGYIPLLAPVGVFLAILLLAAEFLDYSWSRHDMKFKDCASDLKGHLAGYSFGAAFFFMLVSVPLVNLIVPALATSYFTTLWVRNHATGR